MKKISINTILCGGVLLDGMLLSACTDSFDKWNVNPNEATEDAMNRDNLKTGAYFSQMEKGVFIVGTDLGGRYQQDQALEGDLFASYAATINTWGTTTFNNDHYALYPGWYNFPFNDAYTNVMQPWKAIYDATDAKSVARAMATIVKVLGMSRITDMYGPIPYSKFGTAVQVPYDSQEEVYNQFFNELDSAIDVISDYATNNTAAYLGDYDYVYSGNVTKWVKFANTLRLRLAMRVSNVNETKAKQEAQKSISSSFGLMTSADDDAAVHQTASFTFKHPLWEIGESFNDERMSATMDCYLNGYNDPRLPAYFVASVAGGKFAGVRNGIAHVQKSQYQDVSSRQNFSQNSNMDWMHAAEAYFLMAEAKLRWNMGSMTAREYYEQGIRTSFASAGVSGADSYISNSESLPLSTYTDPSNGRNTDVSAMLTMLPVAWDDNATDDENLQRIMIQKWIALYPDGQEAWSEMRRTGYPGWVRIQSYSHQSEVQEGEMISRLKFPTTEYTNNTENTSAAVKLLKGSDAAGTRLWWDVKR